MVSSNNLRNWILTQPILYPYVFETSVFLIYKLNNIYTLFLNYSILIYRNILIINQILKAADFGLAKQFSKTTSKFIIKKEAGTFVYKAPERLVGEDYKKN